MENKKEDLEILSNKAQKAKDNFLQGFTCAQAVIAAFASEQWFIDSGLTLNTAMKLSSSFGGGMGRLREVCGTVSAMFMLAGLRYGFPSPTVKGETNDAKAMHYKRIQELAAEFRTRNGSIVCRELLGLGAASGTNKVATSSVVGNDPFAPVPEVRTNAYYKKRPCADLCAEAASIFEKYLEEHKE